MQGKTLQPAVRYFGVAVEQRDVVVSRFRHAAVDGRNETEIAPVVHHHDAGLLGDAVEPGG